MNRGNNRHAGFISIVKMEGKLGLPMFLRTCRLSTNSQATFHAQFVDTGHLKSGYIDMPPQIPSHSLRFDAQRRRELAPIQVDVNNPIHDSTFIATIAGIGSAGLVVLIVIGLILCLYRDKTICTLCCGKRKRKQKQEEEKPGSTPNLPEPKVPDILLATVDTRSSGTSEATLVARPEPSSQFVDKLHWGV
ncbi:hypothetical protein EG328_010983 [Venturia inaequalis]|uniref:Uncharacterized protein n=1 Tax=Venturia inaequalis TaxID=5025 RepID=A0A8H3V804_VENIN|nr:hypothetical protein EG328_010983 [Venturia inaequalis]KAE9990308.1 hypothetical protein EG327_001592 [Venturia inaequalis]